MTATTPTCAVKDSHGNFVFCPYDSDCGVSTKRQPVCRGADGKYIKGLVGAPCYLVTDHNDPAGSGTKKCDIHCSSTDGKGGSSCM
ncbi:hypothetical protein BCV69DRAFT_299903 [Microstroma glucosiphilum]|uniref:Uncharacterized protein n=1 Tax=Pseudomicrostroma glucosiphilum TaxID=1684307 RepID=A0A316U5P7_9BASI|nr:hypothetical protein BCV69DRAFT_299903 [Pseudomicrostroma glucosiphilum]PWN20164.1 hypothetical protein BCV69DRAFT_299903 [Pseudomicrostroma glucosiphilum]